MNKTIKTLRGDELDLREHRFTTQEELLAFVLKECERYNTWAPTCIPDVLIMTPEQRKLLPVGYDIVRSPYNVMEISVEN